MEIRESKWRTAELNGSRALPFCFPILGLIGLGNCVPLLNRFLNESVRFFGLATLVSLLVPLLLILVPLALVSLTFTRRFSNV